MFIGKVFQQSVLFVSSLDDYVKHIDYAKNTIFNSNQIWFRGQADKNYKLLPSVFRKSSYSLEHERNLKEEFLDKAKGFINSTSLDEIEWYFLMQHFGLKTRLLDWTEGYLFALYFALKLNMDDNKLVDPCVWMINPVELNNISIGIAKVIRTNDPDNKKTINKYLDYKDQQDESPIAISPTYSNERVLRQKGCFTLHSNIESINSVYQKAKNNKIIKINISRKKQDTLLDQLKMAGISESSIFPDLEGLSRELNYKYKF